MTQTNSENPAQTAPRRLPFDVLICTRLKQVILEELAKHPELRSVGVALDYGGRLNDAEGVAKGLWVGLGPGGKVTDPAAVFGSAFQSLRLAEEQFVAALTLIDDWRQTVEALGVEIGKRREELETVEAEIRAGRRRLAPATEQAGPGPQA